MHVRIGTRRSPLARWQASWVANELRNHGVEVELVPLTTEGDRNRQTTVDAFGSVGLFTREIQKALLEDRVDLAVHSLKDLPTVPTEGISLAAIPPVGPAKTCWSPTALHHLKAFPPVVALEREASGDNRNFYTCEKISASSRSAVTWRPV